VAQTRVIPPPPRKQTNLLFRAWSWLNRNCSISSNKQLRVAETISLGDKRFVAVVQVEGRKFLIGGGSAGVSLLTQLGTANDTQAALGAAMASGVIPE
jgi:flagellar biogenesis protein FliO